MGWLYSDVVVEKAKTPAEGRRYIRININHIFRDLNYDWLSGRSYAEQIADEAARRDRLRPIETHGRSQIMECVERLQQIHPTG